MALAHPQLRPRVSARCRGRGFAVEAGFVSQRAAGGGLLPPRAAARRGGSGRAGESLKCARAAQYHAGCSSYVACATRSHTHTHTRPKLEPQRLARGKTAKDHIGAIGIDNGSGLDALIGASSEGSWLGPMHESRRDANTSRRLHSRDGASLPYYGTAAAMRQAQRALRCCPCRANHDVISHPREVAGERVSGVDSRNASRRLVRAEGNSFGVGHNTHVGTFRFLICEK